MSAVIANSWHFWEKGFAFS